MNSRSIRIGNGCGFWGDNLDAPILLAQAVELDYLTLEYLAELTMSILALQKQKDPQTGFASDFLDVLERLIPILQKQPRLKILTNAGGMNPHACAARASALLAKHGVQRSIAVVSGDDLLPQVDSLLGSGESLSNLDTGQALADVRSRLVSANAYLGAAPIVEALRLGASIVITGRVADASLTVAPAVHEFGWSWQDLERLNLATVAGHLIECGAQATGGIHSRWRQIPDLANVPYPYVEMLPDGSFALMKGDRNDPEVPFSVFKEQLLYEVADPANYLTPDVVADFTTLRFDKNRIVSGAGKPATDSYKVSASYRDGFTASGTLVLSGPDAVGKARLSGAMLLDRLRRIGIEPEASHVECLGAGDCVPGVLPMASPPEVVLRVSVRDPRKSVVERFAREFAPLVTSGPAGVTGYTTGRPPVREVFAYWPTLIRKSFVQPVVNEL